MYNIVQNVEFVITWISGLPAIYKARWDFIALKLSYKTSFIYIFQYSIWNEDSLIKEYPIHKIHKTNIKKIFGLPPLSIIPQ